MAEDAEPSVEQAFARLFSQDTVAWVEKALFVVN